MKFLCDVHISLKISKQIEQLGFVSEHVNNILDRWHTKDQDIIKYADKHDLIVITKDQDFRNNFLLNHKPKKLIKINLGNISNNELWKIIKGNITHLESLNSSHNSFMVELNENSALTVTK